MRRLLGRVLETGAAAGLFLCLAWSFRPADVAAAVVAAVLALALTAAGRGRESRTDA